MSVFEKVEKWIVNEKIITNKHIQATPENGVADVNR